MCNKLSNSTSLAPVEGTSGGLFALYTRRAEYIALSRLVQPVYANIPPVVTIYVLELWACGTGEIRATVSLCHF